MDYVTFYLLTWMIGTFLLVLFIWGAIHFTRRKRFIKASMCWLVLLISALSYGYYLYRDHKRTELYKPFDKPLKNSLIVNQNSIPKFLVKKTDHFNGFESASSYVYPEDLKSSGRPPILIVSFELFNDFQSNCKNMSDLNTFVYGRVPTEMIVTKNNQKVSFYKDNHNDFPTMKIFMEDKFGCLEIFTENLSKNLTKEDLLNILNSMIRIQ